MSRKARVILGLIAMLALVDICVWRDSGATNTPSSFGTVPAGHAALFELLEEIELLAGRSLVAPSRLETDDAVWWIEPERVCDSRIANAGDVDVLDPEAVRWRAGDWIDSGGTAVVLLEALGPGKVVCDAIASIGLPARSKREASIVTGALVSEPRELAVESLSVFDEALDWNVIAFVDQKPFVLERVIGKGRLLVVADAGFLRNESLGAADAAPLAVDLARETGLLRIDEYEHGFAVGYDVVSYLVGSAAAPVFVGLAMLGALVAWRGNALPPRQIVDDTMASPTLARFVRSMAALYERSGDHARVLERYRELSAARLRRHFGLSPGTSFERLAERIEREGRSAQVLRDPGFASSASELRAASKRLDRLVEEVMG